MAYERKTRDRYKFPVAWLNRRRAALLAGGLTDRELQVIRLRDVQGRSLGQVGDTLGVTAARGRQIYQQALRKLLNPRRRHLLPPLATK